MQVMTEINDMFSYSWLLLLLFLFGALALFLLYGLLAKEKKKPLENTPILKPLNNQEMKKKYLQELELLQESFLKEKISHRIAFQKLSLFLRNFVFEVTHINVQNYTLSDIEKLNIPQLTRLIRQFYDPEFSIFSQGDVILAINEVKEVIKKWN